MLHYSTDTDGHPCLWREPQEVKEEIRELRRLIDEATTHMKTLEEAKEELLLTLSEEEDYRDGEKIRLLEELCEGAEEEKERLRELSLSMDDLTDELHDSVWWMRGSYIA